MFGGLISTYLIYKNRPGTLDSRRGRLETGSTLKPSTLFDIPFTSVSSFILLASSLTMVLAVTAGRGGDHEDAALARHHGGARGALHRRSGVRVHRRSCARASATPPTSQARAFFTLTGFHGVHVTIGIIMLLTTIGLSLSGRIKRSNAEAVEIVGLYWHFVDVVWILIFTVVYLIP
jgi:heme/copper-type cytochrome/quinol oxidase subunit 3